MAIFSIYDIKRYNREIAIKLAKDRENKTFIQFKVFN